MSYILDSLGKAEKARQVNQSPELKNVFEPDITHSGAKRINHVWYLAGLFVAFFLGLVLSPMLQSFWGNRPAALQTRSFQEDPIKNYAEKIKQDRPLSPAPIQQKIIRQATPAPTASPAQTPVPVPVPVSSTPKVVEPVLTQNIQAASRLKPDQLIVSVISYSEQADKRFAMINGSIVNEGDELADGYLIEQINTQTVELSLGNQRFQLGLK